MEYAVLAVAGVLIVVAVSAFAPKLGIAAPIVLVVVGIGCSYIPGAPQIDVPPELILSVVLPPILYSSAVNVPLMDFRRNLTAISGLSVLLVVVSAVGSGFLLYWLFPELSLAAAIALGAVISPPDAVAATSIGKRLGLPPRLVTVLEGEGLVNDATALVLLRSAIAASASAVEFLDIAGDFAFAVTVAILLGIAVGFITVWVRSMLRDPVLTTAISFAVPFLAYIPAERVGASGVLAVVVAGIVTGHQSARFFTAQDRISERINWRTAQLLLENGVFLVMGFEINAIVNQVQDDHLGVWQAVGFGLLATIVLVVIRVLFVIPLIASMRRSQRRAKRRQRVLESAYRRLSTRTPASPREERGLRRWTAMLERRRADAAFLAEQGLGWRGGAVLAWSGMRGVVTLAAAQSLPEDLPYRPQLILVAFTVAIVTLIAQGGTLPVLIRTIGVVGRDAAADRAELASLIDEIGAVGAAALDNPNLVRDNGQPYDPEIVEGLRHHSRRLSEALREQDDPDSSGVHGQRRALRRMMLEAERAALLDARSTGAYSSHILERAQQILDVEESRLDGA